MSHSQFHSIELFILRHAWLNLWDKHMTTGRINQVTISGLFAITRIATGFRHVLWRLCNISKSRVLHFDGRFAWIEVYLSGLLADSCPLSMVLGNQGYFPGLSSSQALLKALGGVLRLCSIEKATSHPGLYKPRIEVFLRVGTATV